MREGVESNPGPPSIGQTLDWYTGALNKGTFFNLSDGNELKDKKLFKKALESLVRANIKTQQNILREVMKTHKGKGKNCETPPDDFSADITDEKARKSEFAKLCREEMKIGAKYLTWIDKDFYLFEGCKKITQSENEQGRVQETIKLTRERSCGPNIYDATKISSSRNPDGTLKKSVIKQTYANITVREKRMNDDSAYGISDDGIRKRTKLVSNILNHTSQHDKNTKAILVAKIIDKEGAEFGQTIKEKSKVIQETNKMTPEQTTAMITGTRTPDNVWRQFRTTSKNILGYSIIASQKKVDEQREK